MTPSLPDLIVPTRQDLLRMMPPDVGVVVAELGVFAGDFAADMLDTFNPQELHLFDTWAGHIACGDQHGQHVIWRDGEELYRSVLARFHHDPRVSVHRRPTVSIGKSKYGPFDFIYVDAAHEEDAVYWDLVASEGRMTLTGVLAGHDYGPMFPGVVRAVTRFCQVYPWRLWMVTEDGCPSFALRRR